MQLRVVTILDYETRIHEKLPVSSPQAGESGESAVENAERVRMKHPMHTVQIMEQFINIILFLVEIISIKNYIIMRDVVIPNI